MNDVLDPCAITNHLLNTACYTPFQLGLNMAASVRWVAAYVILLMGVKKHKAIEMPMAAATGNIAWELLWSVHFKVNMGALLTWGVRAWLFLDLFIVYFIYKYGVKQIETPLIRKYRGPLMLGMFLIWGAFFYAFTSQGLDTPMGARSALVLNVVMSMAYLAQSLRPQSGGFHSVEIAICKGLGTGLFTLFVFIATPTDYLSMTLGAISFILDALYTIRIWYTDRSLGIPVRHIW